MQKYLVYGGVILSVFLILATIIFILVWYFTQKGNYGSSCSSQSDCSTGLICDPQTKICRGGVGSICDKDRSCAGSLVCVDGTCSSVPPKRYQPIPLQNRPISQPVEEIPYEIVDPISLPRKRVYASTNYNENSFPGEERVKYPQVSLPSKNTRNYSTGRDEFRNDLDQERRTFSVSVYEEQSENSEFSLPLPVKQVYVQSEETNSGDSEINSIGELTDAAFDIRSGPSTLEEPISSPFEEREGAMYSRPSSEETQGFRAPVTGVCSFSEMTIFLLADGSVVSSSQGKRRKVNSNVVLTVIAPFRGYLYALGNSRHHPVSSLYTLSNDQLSKNEWNWSICSWAPPDLYHLSATLDGKNLWMQNLNCGYLYSEPGRLEEEVITTFKRIYGRDFENYLEIDSSNFSVLLFPGRILIHDVWEAVLTYHGEVIAISPRERHQYSGLALVDWKPYYMRK